MKHSRFFLFNKKTFKYRLTITEYNSQNNSLYTQQSSETFEFKYFI